MKILLTASAITLQPPTTGKGECMPRTKKAEENIARLAELLKDGPMTGKEIKRLTGWSDQQLFVTVTGTSFRHLLWEEQMPNRQMLYGINKGER